MYKLISQKKDIDEIQQKLIDKFSSLNPTKIQSKVKFQGGIEDVEMLYFAEYDFWTVNWEVPKSFEEFKNCNYFGKGKPSAYKPNQILCEINIQRPITNKTHQGVFAQDIKNNDIVILHRGAFNQIKREEFLKEYKEKRVPALDIDNETSEFLFVADLHSNKFIVDINDFLTETNRVKKKFELKKKLLKQSKDMQLLVHNIGWR